MKTYENDPIDIVIPWVDPKDPGWQQSRIEWSAREGRTSVADDSENRYRDWNTLKYLFRSIDQYAPWVRTVHFVTCGHLPCWMNADAPGLHIVKHSDYMAPEYLPTFSSHAIELNMNRIDGLAERFIYFNDDIVILQETRPSDFFLKGLPRDYAILNPAISSHRYSVMDTAITDIEIINDHFKKNKVIVRNLFKWFNIRYGINNLKTLLLMPWPRFSHMYGRHLCNSFLKSTFEEIWEKEYEALHSTSMHKFRTRRDANQWLMREWQIAQGKFEPISPNFGRYYTLQDDNSALLEAIQKRKYRIICANDNWDGDINDFQGEKKRLCDALEKVFPNRSTFEHSI